MGLGKTITLIALHLTPPERSGVRGPHSRGLPDLPDGQLAAGDRAVRARHPVRRFHGARRTLDDLADGGFVLTTYGTMRLDAPRSPGSPGAWSSPTRPST
ncbi:hypothetical protein GCM10023238_23150 [Streptomyces heliomycini]